MTKTQEAKKFAKAHGLKINTSGGIPMLSREISPNYFWIEVFDNWDEAHAFLRTAKLNRENTGAKFPWM
jgi:hypothetical protein